jgi:hypothetical protein
VRAARGVQKHPGDPEHEERFAMTSVVPVRVVPGPTQRGELRVWVTALIVSTMWFQVLAESTRGRVAGAAWLAPLAGLAAQLGFTALEAAIAMALWRALGARVSWSTLVPRLQISSAAETLAIDITSGHATLPRPIAVVLAGPRAADAAGASHGLAAAFAAAGVLALVRLILSASLQSRAAGAPFARAFGLVLFMWLASRLIVWWGFDLLQGRSFQP